MASVAATYLPTIWAAESIQVLRDNLVMARSVYRGYEAEVAQAGDRVKTRLPHKLHAHRWTGQTGTNAEAVEDKRVDLLTASNLTILLDKVAYTSYLVQDTDQAMSIKNLREEFVIPAIDPLSQEVDDDIMAEFVSPASADVNGVAVDVIASGTIGAGAAMAVADLIEADLQLNVDQAPRDGQRKVVLSPQHYADLLSLGLFHQANTAGTTEALRNAQLTRAFGFDVMMSQNVPGAIDTDDTPQSIAFHTNAMALVTRDLDTDTPNQNGARAARSQIDGISLRVLQQYLALKNGLVVISEILYGVQLLDARLAKIINP